MKRIGFVLIFSALVSFIFAQTTQTLSEDKTYETASGMKILCKSGTTVKLNEQGKLLECVPKNDIVFRNKKNFKYVIAADHKVTFDHQGNPISFWLKYNAMVETGHKDHYSALGNNPISFYPSGLVQSFVPKFDIKVYSALEIPYTAKAREEVEFYESGYVKSFVTAYNIKITDTDGNRQTVAAGTRVNLNKKGRLVK